MSFPITDHVGLRVTGLSQAISGFSGNGIFMGVWIKVTTSGGSDYLRGFRMYSDSDGTAPRMGINSYPNRFAWCEAKRAGGSGFNVIKTDEAATDSAWVLYWSKWTAASGDITVGFGDMTGYTESGPSDWVSVGGTIKAMELGIRRGDDASSDEYSTNSYKAAMPFIAKRLPTSGELTSLVGGTHPVDVFGADLLDYWPLNSKTSGTNSWVFSDVSDNASTITVDSGDNPSVSDPSGGATIYRPTSDVTTTGWSTSTGSNFYALVDETSFDDADYVISPTVSASTAPITMGLSGTLSAGTYTVRVRARTTTGAARMRVFLLDGSNVQQGVSTYQTLSTSFATYSFAVTTSGSATRLRIETVVV